MLLISFLYFRSYNVSQLLICQISTSMLLKIDCILGKFLIFFRFIFAATYVDLGSPIVDCNMSVLFNVIWTKNIFLRGSSSFTRRSCQTVLSTHLVSILRVIAPIVPHLAEDVWQNLPFEHRNEDGSAAKFVFELKWPMLNEQRLSFPAEDILFWERLLEVSKISLNHSVNKLSGSTPYLYTICL